MTRPRGVELTEAFFEQCHLYLSGQRSANACADELRKAGKNKSLSTNTFLNWVTEAYVQGYLVLRTKSDDKTRNTLLTYINSCLNKVIIPHVAAGKPSHDMFALFAAECVINMLKGLLQENKSEISLGVVSGTSVSETIRQIVQSSLWDDIIGPNYEVGNKLERINVLTLSIPFAVGEDLYGNAIASVVDFSRFLSQKLAVEVMPYGMMSPLIVNEAERAKNDIVNSKQLQIVDPVRLADSQRRVGELEKQNGERHSREESAGADMLQGLPAEGRCDSAKPDSHSRLDMVLLGAGPQKEQSVFATALNTATLDWPKDAIGDVGLIPMTREGKAAMLRDNKGDPVFVYGLLSAQLMKWLVDAGRRVVLIARNSRPIRYTAGSHELQKTDKVESIKAAIRGGFCNFLITDKAAADAMMGSRESF